MSGDDVCWLKSNHVALVYLVRSLNINIHEMGRHDKEISSRKVYNLKKGFKGVPLASKLRTDRKRETLRVTRTIQASDNSGCTRDVVARVVRRGHFPIDLEDGKSWR